MVLMVLRIDEKHFYVGQSEEINPQIKEEVIERKNETGRVIISNNIYKIAHQVL